MKKIVSILAMIILIAACKKDSTSEPDQTPTTTPTLFDVDGNGYDTVKIGTQFWMKQNLKTSHYRNGDPIPQVTNNITWGGLTSGAWCYLDNVSANGIVYGKLYNWYAVNDSRGLAPVGWHVPSEAELRTLLTYLGGSLSGGAMKETGTAHWLSPNYATNSSGFTALPGGSRGKYEFSKNMGSEGYWWCSSVYNNFAHFYSLNNENGNVEIYYMYKENGFSVRCVKD